MMSLLGAFLLLASSHLVAAQTLVYVKDIVQDSPGLMNIFEHLRSEDDTVEEYSVLAATYSLTPYSYDDSVMLYTPGNYLANGTEQEIYRLSNVLYWPKEINTVVPGAFQFPGVSTADGSLVEGKTWGKVYVTDISNLEFPGTYDLIQDNTNQQYMYNDLLWKQADNFGRPDVVCCRVKIDQDTVVAAELISLIHPEFPQNDLVASWNVRILKESACDTNMDQARLSSGVIDFDVVYTTGFWSLKLAFFWSIDAAESWFYAEDILGGVVETGRRYYDVRLLDLNNDDAVEVIATVASNTDGSVEAWEIPADFRVEEAYINHVLATGFAARNNGPDGVAPGVIKGFWPSPDITRKPYLLLAGADDGRAYYLEAVSQDELDFTYDVVTITDRGEDQVVHGVASADVDGDAYPEVFISSHNENLIEVWSFVDND